MRSAAEAAGDMVLEERPAAVLDLAEQGLKEGDVVGAVDGGLALVLTRSAGMALASMGRRREVSAYTGEREARFAAARAQQRLRRWHFVSAVAHSLLYIGWTGAWIIIPVLLIFPLQGYSTWFRVSFLAFVVAPGVIVGIGYFIWTWFGLGNDKVPLRSALLWLCLVSVCAYSFDASLLQYRKDADDAVLGIALEPPFAFLLMRPDLTILPCLGVWLVRKRLILGPYGCLAFHWLLFSCFVWGADLYWPLYKGLWG
jgi:hypothetical protein